MWTELSSNSVCSRAETAAVVASVFLSFSRGPSQDTAQVHHDDSCLQLPTLARLSFFPLSVLSLSPDDARPTTNKQYLCKIVAVCHHRYPIVHDGMGRMTPSAALGWLPHARLSPPIGALPRAPHGLDQFDSWLADAHCEPLPRSLSRRARYSTQVGVVTWARCDRPHGECLR